LSTHLRLGLPSGLFPSGFPTNILYAFLVSPITEILTPLGGIKIEDVSKSVALKIQNYIAFMLIFFLICAVELLGTAAATGLLYQPQMMWRNWWDKDWQGKPKFSEKTP
jgi:hypothetical protein